MKIIACIALTALCLTACGAQYNETAICATPLGTMVKKHVATETHYGTTLVTESTGEGFTTATANCLILNDKASAE